MTNSDLIFVEIGAVLFNVENGKIIDRFRQLVRPTHHRLSAKFTELFGFTESQLADAPTLKEALQRFATWFHSEKPDYNKLGFEPEMTRRKRNNVFICTWSPHDLRDVLPREAAEKEIYYDECMTKWMDMQRLVKVNED